MPSKFIELDSSFRDRKLYPDPGSFTADVTPPNNIITADNAKDPVSNQCIVAKWRNSEFMISTSPGVAYNGIRLKPYTRDLPDNQPYSSSENDHLTLTSIIDPASTIGVAGLQPLDDYYVGATINCDSPAASTRIIEYRYVNSNKCIIRTETNIVVTETSILQIVDPSLDYVGTETGAKDELLIFVPYGGSDSSFKDSVLIDSTTGSTYTILDYLFHRNMIKVKGAFENPIGAVDYLEIRRFKPVVKEEDLHILNSFPMSDVVVDYKKSFVIDSNLSATTASTITTGDFFEIGHDTKRGNFTPGGSSNNQIFLAAGESTEPYVYDGCTIRVTMSKSVAPDIWTCNDRIVSTYGTGMFSVVIVVGGTGYTTAPTVVISGGGGSGATGTAVVSAGVIQSVAIVTAGIGYTSAPTISFTGGGGINGAATSTVSSRTVTVDSPFDNALSDYDTFTYIIFASYESRRISRFVNETLKTYPNWVVSAVDRLTTINLIDYSPAASNTGSIPTDSFGNPTYNTLDINLSRINGYYTDMYVSASNDGGSTWNYGYIVKHVVTYVGKNIGYNYIEVNSDFGAIVTPGTTDILICGGHVDKAFSRNPYSKLAAGFEAYSVLKFSNDNHVFMNTERDRNVIPSRQTITIVNMTLPNKRLITGKGGYITDYPYVYVVFTNSTSIKKNEHFISNNSTAFERTFRMVVGNIETDSSHAFVTLQNQEMTHTQLFDYHDDIEFAVYLPDGSLFKTEKVDNIGPRSPDPGIQISALFKLDTV